MHSLTDKVCQPSYGKDVASAVQVEHVIFVQSIASDDFIAYSGESRIVRLKWMGHFSDDTLMNLVKSLDAIMARRVGFERIRIKPSTTKDTKVHKRKSS